MLTRPGALAVRGNLPLNVQRVRLVTGKRKLVKQFAQSTRQIGEHRADKALLRTRAHQITADALAEQRTDGIDNDTLARAGSRRKARSDPYQVRCLRVR